MAGLGEVICDVVDGRKLLGLTGEGGNASDVADGDDVLGTVVVIRAFVEVSGESIEESGNGCSEVVKLERQQSSPPRICCPAAPAQHQLLPFSSQRFTSGKPSN